MSRLESEKFRNITLVGSAEKIAQQKEILNGGDFTGVGAKYEPYVLESTPEEKRIWEEVKLAADELIRSYGATPEELPAQLTVLQPDAINKISNGLAREGQVDMRGTRVYFERVASPSRFCVGVAHELLHLKSPKKILAQKGLPLARSGIRMIRRNPEGEVLKYMASIEEALVSELGEQIMERSRDRRIVAERAQMARIRNLMFTVWENVDRHTLTEEIKVAVRHIVWIPEMHEVELMLGGNHGNDQEALQRKWEFLKQKFGEWKNLGGVEAPRLEEREKLWRICYEIFQASAGVYRNKEEVFADFVKANFSGNLLALARKLDRIMGKGSLRSLASVSTERVFRNPELVAQEKQEEEQSA